MTPPTVPGDARRSGDGRRAGGDPRHAGASLDGGRYLLAVYRSPGDDRVENAALRERLGVAASSVSEMVGRLADRGLLDHLAYGGVLLTDRGEEVAADLAWRQCVVADFFGGTLDAPVAEQTAYRVGFVLPAPGVERLAALVDHPCEGGDPGVEGCLLAEA